MQAEKVIEIIDEYLVSTGKRFIGLRAAISLLNSKTKESIDLKGMLERNVRFPPSCRKMHNDYKSTHIVDTLECMIGIRGILS